MSPPLIDAVVTHATSTRLGDIPLQVRDVTRLFLLDAFGVGNAGSATSESQAVRAASARWGSGAESRIWGAGPLTTAGTAAFVNSHHMHSQEFDAINEAAVVHPLTVVVPALIAWMQREQATGRTFTGADLMAATVIGVDVAAGLGRAATSALEFFRPSVCGGMGAAAAIISADQTSFDVARSVFGITYGSVSGTMQPHTEGAPVLATQCGLNARAAIHAFDLATAGISGPEYVLEGRYGWYTLIERSGDPEALVAALGQRWEIAETSIKPFPSGRATHGGLDAARQLQEQHGFRVGDVESVSVRVPPLVFDLVGRAPEPSMELGAARLCLALLIPHMLRDGRVGVETFTPDRLNDASMLAIAAKVRVERDDNSDPNAFLPQHIEISLNDGRRFETAMRATLGSPDRPLGRDGVTAKFRANLASIGGAGRADPIIDLVDRLEDLDDIAPLLELL